MGTTGSSDKVAINTELPDIIARVREHATVAIAVGFGVSNRSHFDYVADAGADGVVVGSRIVNVIKSAPADKVSHSVEAFCSEITLKGQSPKARSPLPARSPAPVTNGRKDVSKDSSVSDLPARFGQFGGQYVPESLVDCLAELEEAHKSAINDPEFLKEFQSYYEYINRPSGLYLAENLTKHAGGANIWLKREDLYANVFPLAFPADVSTAETTRDLTKLTTRLVKQAVSHTSLGKFADLGKTDSPSSPYWQDAYYRRNGCGSAWCCDSNGLRQIRLGMYNLHGS